MYAVVQLLLLKSLQSICPQAKTLFNSSRITRTIDWLHQIATKETTPAGKKTCMLPDHVCAVMSLEQRWKWRFSASLHSQLASWRNGEAQDSGTLFNTTTVKVKPEKGQLLHFTYRRIKYYWHNKVGKSTFYLKRDPSHVSMAPCRSHHGNHTWYKWIMSVILCPMGTKCPKTHN